jgi:hypothetical protein
MNQHFILLLQTMFSSEDLCDDEWHTVKLMREGPRVVLQVDNDVPTTGKYLARD